MRKLILPILLFVQIASTNAQQAVLESANTTTAGTLTVTATTSLAWGGYAPSNIVAIWLEDNTGKFVKTLLAYAQERKQYLTNFIASTANNRVDAISGATQISFGVNTCTWNGTNVSKVLVPDGTYTVKMELTDDDLTGNLGTFTFIKGTTSQTLTPANVPSFSNISIKWIPATTGIDEVKLEKFYTVYPNPTKSTIFINGSDIQQIEIFTLDGKSILKTNQQYVNLNSISEGSYLALITTSNGSFIKKIIKE